MSRSFVSPPTVAVDDINVTIYKDGRHVVRLGEALMFLTPADAERLRDALSASLDAAAVTE